MLGFNLTYTTLLALGLLPKPIGLWPKSICSYMETIHFYANQLLSYGAQIKNCIQISPVIPQVDSTSGSGIL
jgi:hypothetical protein